MRHLVTALLCCAVICGLAAAAAQADDKVDSPIYKHWARFRPGAFSVVKTQRKAKDVKAETTVTTTLIEVTPEKVVVELQVATVGGDEKIEMMPKKQIYPAKIEKDEAQKMEDPKKGDKVEDAEVTDVKQGEEEIKVGDKKINCKWLQTKCKQGDQITTTEAWTSDEVPGQVVKMLVTMEGGVAMTSETLLVKYNADDIGKAEQAGEKVDNPLYKHWAKFKPGAFSEMRTESETMGEKSETTSTTTLKELIPEKAVIEISTVTMAAGRKMEMPAQKQEIFAKVEDEKAKEMAKEMDTPKKGDRMNGAEVIDVGEEEVKVGDKKIKCKWVEEKMKQEDSTIFTKSWTSEDVPDQVVKMVMTVEGKMKSSSESLLVKYSVDGSSKPDSAGQTGQPKKVDKKDDSEKKESKEKK